MRKGSAFALAELFLDFGYEDEDEDDDEAATAKEDDTFRFFLKPCVISASAAK